MKPKPKSLVDTSRTFAVRLLVVDFPLKQAFQTEMPKVFPLLLSLLLMASQGVPRQEGTLTGTLRDSAGMPLAGVRMAAIPRPDEAEPGSASTVLVAIAETDSEGRFRLEGILSGRYVIAAGRLNRQTFYPGTQSLEDATILTMAPAAIISNINFVLNDTSAGRDPVGSPAAVRRPNATSIPVVVKVINGNLPVVSNGKNVNIVLISASNEVRIPIDRRVLNVPGAITEDFRVKLESLPDTYEVDSISYGSTNVTRSAFRLSGSRSAISIVIRAVPPSNP